MNGEMKLPFLHIHDNHFHYRFRLFIVQTPRTTLKQLSAISDTYWSIVIVARRPKKFDMICHLLWNRHLPCLDRWIRLHSRWTNDDQNARLLIPSHLRCRLRRDNSSWIKWIHWALVSLWWGKRRMIGGARLHKLVIQESVAEEKWSHSQSWSFVLDIWETVDHALLLFAVKAKEY